MTAAVREKFSSQATPDVLASLRQIAESQGRQFQAVLDDALRDYIDRQQKERPRRHVMASFASSLDDSIMPLCITVSTPSSLLDQFPHQRGKVRVLSLLHQLVNLGRMLFPNIHANAPSTLFHEALPHSGLPLG